MKKYRCEGEEHVQRVHVYYTCTAVCRCEDIYVACLCVDIMFYYMPYIML
jgi:hypothetical protein